jgi:hypothetical protein
MSEKSILEQALLQVQTLEEAVKANAKGILASTMKQELTDLLKESLEEEEEVVAEQPDSEEETQDDVPAEAGDEEGGLDNDEEGDEESSDDELSKDIESLDSEDEMGPEMDDMGPEGMEDDDTVDMTDADEDEVLKVFKAMGPEDGIIVKKDENHIELEDGDDEYIIKLDEEETHEEETMEETFDEPMEEMGDVEESMVEPAPEVSEDWNEGEEVVYEIELDEEGEESNEEEVSEETFDEPHEEEMGEAARTKWNAHGDKGEAERAGIKSKKVFAAGAINEEVENLKKQNAEYKKALVLFKEKLNEVAVFNANLAYATRLFTEHSTTKQEKLNILKRFDSISTLKESKNLYSTIKTELDTKKPISESVVDKITSAPSTSSSTEVLSESKAYENPQFKRMKDLMSKIK